MFNVQFEVTLRKVKRAVCGHRALGWRRNEQEQALLVGLLGARLTILCCEREWRLVGRSRLPLQFRKLLGLGWTATSYFSPGFAVRMISGFGQEHCIKDDPNYQNRHSLCGVYA